MTFRLLDITRRNINQSHRSCYLRQYTSSSEHQALSLLYFTRKVLGAKDLDLQRTTTTLSASAKLQDLRRVINIAII